MQKETFVCTTKVVDSEISYVWRIEDYTKLPLSDEVPLKGPSFSATEIPEVTWDVCMYPRKSDLNDIYVKIAPKNFPESACVRVKCECLVEGGKEIFYVGTYEKLFKGSMGIGDCLRMQIKSGNNLLIFDEISDMLVLKLYLRFFHCSSSLFHERAPQIPGSTLLTDLREAYSSLEFSDFTITVDGKDIPVHKFVLSARSPVFSVMLKSENEETVTNKLIIEEFQFDVMKCFIRYLYTDDLLEEYSLDMYMELHSVAERYEVIALKKLCVERIIEYHLTVDNACKVYNFASFVDDEHLKRVTTKFIRQNAASIFKSENWKKFCDEDITCATEILQTAIYRA